MIMIMVMLMLVVLVLVLVLALVLVQALAMVMILVPLLYWCHYCGYYCCFGLNGDNSLCALHDEGDDCTKDLLLNRCSFFLVFFCLVLSCLFLCYCILLDI
ncbi:hypothetical protein J3Q64DRAFT_1707484, partial [Phycomyces blakesleeanus]